MATREGLSLSPVGGLGREHTTTLRRGILVLLCGLMAALAAWAGLHAAAAWRLRSGLRQAQRELDAQQFGAAKSRLARLAKRWPERGDVLYLLGAALLAEGHIEPALEAWGRIPERAPEAAAGALSRGRLAAESGHYSIAEPCLERAIRAGGPIADEGHSLLSQLYRMIGRNDLYRQELKRRAERERRSLANSRIALEQRARCAGDRGNQRVAGAGPAHGSDDDRVWLALANLATRTGSLDEAGPLLDRCEQARPDDPSVWLARLDWAQAAGRPDEVLRAAAHLAPSSLTPAQILVLRAWVSIETEITAVNDPALQELIALAPGHAAGLERLADLAAEDKQWKDVAELRRRKAASDAARDRYHVLVNLPDPAPHAPELARAALQIDRPFEARLWWSLAARQETPAQARAEAEAGIQAARARLAMATGPAAAASGRTLAYLLGPTDSRRGSQTAGTLVLVGTIPQFVDEAQRRGVVFTFDNGQTEPPPAPRDDERRRRPVSTSTATAGSTSTPSKEGRFHRPGIDRRRSATGSSATGATAGSRTSPPRPAWPDCPAAMAMASPSATTTTTAAPTSSSPAGGPMPCTTTSATAGSRTPPPARAWAATATGRPRRRGPTSTTTATSTSTSATIVKCDARDNPDSAGTAAIRNNVTLLRPAQLRRAAGPSSSATTAAGSST